MPQNLFASSLGYIGEESKKQLVSLLVIATVFGCYRSSAFFFSGSSVFFDCFNDRSKAVDSKPFIRFAVLVNGELRTARILEVLHRQSIVFLRILLSDFDCSLNVRWAFRANF